MKVYITGGRGMVGANLVETKPKNITVLTPTHKELDLLNYDSIKDFLEKNKPDFIINCAGKVGGIQANMSDLYTFLMDNTIMGLNLIRAAKEVGIKKMINLSSSCVYPVNAPIPFKEESFLTGSLEPTNEGYALAKNSVMRACEYLSKEHSKFQFKTIVPVNLYGRHDKFSNKRSHMIPAVIKKIAQAVENKENIVEIWGTGKVKREFLYAGDLAEFIWHAINNFDKMPSVLNCSPGIDYTIDEFYQKIAKTLGYNGKFSHNTSKPDGIKRKLTDNSKMKKFGWEPKTSFEDGVRKAYEFFKNEYKENDKK